MVRTELGTDESAAIEALGGAGNRDRFTLFDGVDCCYTERVFGVTDPG